jgi:hypothetical protein
MNYVAELNAFHDWLETNSLSTNAICLWFALVRINNKCFWQTNFTVSLSRLSDNTGGLSSDSIQRARNELQQKGLIKWKKRGGNNSAEYTIIPLVTLTEQQSQQQGQQQSQRQGQQQSQYINKLNVKENETKPPPLPVSPTEGRYYGGGGGDGGELDENPDGLPLTDYLFEVECSARSAGLPTAPMQLAIAESLCREFGGENVLKAIPIAAEGAAQTWAYVKGILKKARTDGGFDVKKQSSGQSVDPIKWF